MNIILWILAAIPVAIFAFVILGAIGASVCDWWYWRKYGFWITLKEDANNQQKPSAK